MFVLPSFVQQTCRYYNDTACIVSMTDLAGYTQGSAVDVQVQDVSTLSSVGTGALYITVPSQVTSVQATRTTSNSTVVTWHAAADGGSTVLDYTLYGGVDVLVNLTTTQATFC